jgi:hypothetical protein
MARPISHLDDTSRLQGFSDEARRHLVLVDKKKPKYPKTVVVSRAGEARVHVKPKKATGTVFIFPHSQSEHKPIKRKVKRKAKK